MDPSYFHTGKLTRKSDVYAFGVVLFEILSGRQAVDSKLDEEQWGLAPWAQSQIKEGKVNEIIDSRLIRQISKKCLKQFVSIAGHCLRTKPKDSPTMAEVVIKLKSILSQEREKKISVVSKEKVLYKVRDFFTCNFDMMSDGRVRSKSVMSDVAVRSKFVVPDVTGGRKSLMSGVAGGSKSVKKDDKVLSKSDFSAQNIRKSTTGSIRIFTYDELSYAPTESGVGLAIYVRKEEILTWKLDLKILEFSHPNITKLLGYCLSNVTMFWVYELIPGICLDDHLFKDRTPLSWAARLKIAQGAAKGLSFFHQRNLPAYNSFDGNHILVDRDFNARLLDYKIDNLLAPTGCSTFKTDKLDGIFGFVPGDESGVQSEIYAFGVVLLKMLTGMKKYDERIPLQRKILMEWATPLLANEVNLGMIMDPQLQHNDHPPKGAFKLAQLVLKCLQPTRGKNLSIEEISQALYQCYQKEITSV
ncbi:unnamed protein product [Lactuca saligna]|uniref:Protein kinase domain-containing protein n=1 Tax=Lactuca saligna TaxID=75948 RepID=A0AA35ZJV0_LACSI|nr:unnamed protein product [Lactuca saligna]